MSLLLHGDCLEHLHSVDDNSVDLIFCDLPYGQTSCKWDCKIDLTKLWDHFMRIKKLNTPLFFTTTTKFGCDLIQSAPKKCFFRYDLVWVKSAPAGFLSAKKMPMRKHEMVYVFYEKLPLYDLSSHTHKFIKERDAGQKNGSVYGGEEGKKLMEGKYEPPLPVSVMKEEPKQIIKGENNTYNTEGRKKPIVREKGDKYEPPLPVSVVKEESGGATGGERKLKDKNSNKGGLYCKINRLEDIKYDPPLPVSVVKEESGGATGLRKDNHKTAYGENIHYHNNEQKNGESIYNPPLPVSVVKEDVYKANERFKNGKLTKHARNLQKGDDPIYDPPLPNSMLEIKSTRGKHSTEKPVALMEWILKYYSKEGDTILDPTMGSGSTGIACKNMNRNFIGIEKDPEIYEGAVNRIEG